MTLNEFKHTDLYYVLKGAGELSTSIAKFLLKTSQFILKGFTWLLKKSYSYVMR